MAIAGRETAAPAGVLVLRRAGVPVEAAVEVEAEAEVGYEVKYIYCSGAVVVPYERTFEFFLIVRPTYRQRELTVATATLKPKDITVYRALKVFGYHEVRWM